MAQPPAQPSGSRPSPAPRAAEKRPVTAMVRNNPKAAASHRGAPPKTAKEINDILHGLILAGRANTKEFDEWQTALYRLPRQSTNWWERLNATAKQLDAADEGGDEGEDDDEEDEEDEEDAEDDDEEGEADDDEEEDESPCASECEEDDAAES
jgi:hypothetical protein